MTGVSQPTVSVTGAALPEVRLLSKSLFPDVPNEDQHSTLVTMQWGQLITHDMSLAAGTTQARKLTRLSILIYILIRTRELGYKDL